MTRRLLLTTREAAEALGVAPATIRDWQRRGLVTRGPGGRWDLLDLRAAQHAPKPRRPERRTGALGRVADRAPGQDRDRGHVRQPGNPPPTDHDEP